MVYTKCPGVSKVINVWMYHWSSIGFLRIPSDDLSSVLFVLLGYPFLWCIKIYKSVLLGYLLEFLGISVGFPRLFRGKSGIPMSPLGVPLGSMGYQLL